MRSNGRLAFCNGTCAEALLRFLRRQLDDRDRSVVVAVLFVRVMEVAVDKVVDVVSVGYRFVTAPGTVHMSGIMSLAHVAARAAVRMSGINGQNMLVVVITMGMEKVSVLQEIGVIAVFYRHMPALRTVLVNVTTVFVAIHHILPFLMPTGA